MKLFVRLPARIRKCPMLGTAIRTALVLLAVTSSFHGVVIAQNPTLAGVLKQESVPFPPASIPHLNAVINSYSTLSDDHEFLIAYYLDNPKNELRFPLFVTRLNKLSRKWDRVELAGMKGKVFEGNDDKMEDDCLGSVLSIKSTAESYYLNLHWSPSAGCLLILNRDLSVSQTLGGWAVAFFRSGRFIYSGNMVHFADVHPETLFLYDPSTHRSFRLYPQKNDPFRDNFSTWLEKVTDKEACAENNQACEPDRFTSNLDSIEVNDETNSLGFRVSFKTEGFSTKQLSERDELYDADCVYIFKLSPLDWREFSIFDLKPTFGTNSVKELLAPAMINRVFSASAPSP